MISARANDVTTILLTTVGAALLFSASGCGKPRTAETVETIVVNGDWEEDKEGVRSVTSGDWTLEAWPSGTLLAVGDRTDLKFQFVCQAEQQSDMTGAAQVAIDVIPVADGAKQTAIHRATHNIVFERARDKPRCWRVSLKDALQNSVKELGRGEYTLHIQVTLQNGARFDIGDFPIYFWAGAVRR